MSWFEEHFDIRTSKTGIKMDAATKHQARAELKRQLGFDVLEGLDKNANRMEVSKTALKEKLAAIKPDDAYVLVSSVQKQLFLLSGSLALPDGVSLRVPVTQLNLSTYQQMIIVENLDVFDALSDFTLPVTGATLLVYRGHEKSVAKGAKSLIHKAKGELPVYWFGDLDPQGLELALSTDGVEYVISADLSDDMQALRDLSDIDKWQKQDNAIRWCKKTPQKSHPLVASVLEEHLAVMQQHLLTRNIPLKAYNVIGIKPENLN